MFRHILVPTDGSPHSTRAARLAISLVRSSRGKITALHVVPPFVPIAYMDSVVAYPELYSPKEYKRLTHKEAARMLARIERLAAAARVRCETAIVDADSEWKAILAAARTRRCDAIAMGTHGRRGLDAVLLGSVASKVLTHATKPVIVCR
jgi:nucleotide-binding universal stress UspA family protein